MDQEFFNYLPSDITINILSRLPVRSIAICKCVCKSWLNLVGTREFVKFHLSQSAPGLVVGIQRGKKSYQIFEVNDDLDLERHELHYRLSTEFIFPHYAVLQGSTNGLLFFRRKHGIYICNPITRDYIKLPKGFGRMGEFEAATYGFGASKTRGQHKVVEIISRYTKKYDPLDYGGVYAGAISTRCQVYTLGTRSWRSIAASSGDPLHYGAGLSGGVFVNGNFHWMVRDVNGSWLISCFDFETEVFGTFPCPPSRGFGGRLCVVGNCLCFCECTWFDGMIIWLMKEYGVEKSWTKEFVITNNSSALPDSVYPIKVFRDGDILIAPFMFYYSAKTPNVSQELGVFDQSEEAIVYTPSFLSLKNFGTATAAATSF